MKKISKLMLSGTGVLSTTAVLSVAISCSHDTGTTGSTVDQKAEDKKLVDAVTKADVLKAVTAKVGTIGETTATAAEGLITGVTIKAQDLIKDAAAGDVKIEVTVVADEENQKVTFTVTKVSKGEASKAKVNDLGGEITGFKENATYKQDKADVMAVFNATNKAGNAALVDNAVKALFTAKIKEDSATAAIAAVAKEVTITFNAKEYDITFEVVKGADETKAKYTVTKVARGIYAATTGVDVLGKDIEITGFNTKAAAAETLIKAAVDANKADTIAAIKAQLEPKLGDKITTTADAAVVTFKALPATEKILTLTGGAKYEGIKVKVIVAKDTTVLTTVNYTVTELAKDGFTYTTQAGLDAVKGSVAGFASIEFIGAKTLIDNVISTNKDVTKAAIKEAIKSSLSANANTAIAAKKVFDGLATKTVTLPAINALYSGIVVEFNVTNANQKDGKITYTISKLSKGGYELTTGVNVLDGEVDGFQAATQLSLPTKMNLPIVTGASGTTGVGVYEKADANIANTTVKHEWKSTAGGTYATFGTSDDFRDGWWVKVTWTASDAHIFNDDSQSMSLEYPIKVYPAANKVDVEAIKRAIYVDNANTKAEIKTKITAALGETSTQTAQAAITALANKQVTLANGIKVEFATTASTGISSSMVNYVITKLSKNGIEYLPVEQSDLTDLNESVPGFAKTAAEAAETLIKEKMSAANQTATKTAIKNAVEGKFTAKEQPVADAITAVGDLEVTIADGVLVTFTAKAKASDSTILEFRITKLSKHGFELTTGLGTMGGEITGFWSVEKGKAKILIDNVISTNKDITQAAIKWEIKSALNANTNTADEAKELFDQLINKTVVLPPINALYSGIIVEFNVTSVNQKDGKITYTISKLSKDGYELTTGVNVLDGEVDGFQTS